MEIKVIGSGSSGNCYILTDGKDDLLLDAGVAIDEIKRGLNFNVMNVRGLLITHIHKDHTKSLEKLLKSGIVSYMNPSVKKYYEDYYNAISVDPFKPFAFGNSSIVSYGFNLPHDDVECYGYFIKWKDTNRILYLTDLEYCPIDLTPTKPTDIIVECNYCEDMVDMEAANTQHKLLGHMGLKTCIDFIKHIKHDGLNNILLCHRGLDTSDPDVMVREVKAIIPNANVYVCSKGKTFDLKGQ